MLPPRILSLLLAPLTVHGINIVMSNDDGWAEKNIRVFYDVLKASGQNVLISGPAENKSGSGSTDVPPTKVGADGCQFSSCPPNSPPTGSDPTNDRFNYVNSFPVTAMKYGLKELAPKLLGGPAELAVAGPNVGGNLGPVVLFSGTVGAATEASKEGVPGIAFSGATGEQVGPNVPTEVYQQVYADLSANVTNTLVDSGAPYLPEKIWLNVNYPEVSASKCSKASDFKFVLSSIYGLGLGQDVDTCGSSTLPSEMAVVGEDSGCYASISVGYADFKTAAGKDAQQVVLKKLGPILSCLP